MLEGDLKRTAISGTEHRRRGAQDLARFTKNDLMKLVEEFDSELQAGQRAIATVDQVARESGDFLMEKIFGAAQGDIFDFNS